MRPRVEKFRSGITRTTDQPCDRGSAVGMGVFHIRQGLRATNAAPGVVL